MTSDWRWTSIGSVAHPVQRPEVPIPGKVYRQIGVRLWGEGAYERESLDGAATKYATLSRVESGDIIVNKIWARNGSVSVVAPTLEGCYCSSEFPQFAPDRTLLEPRWFYWMTKTRWFWQACDIQSQGTSGKNRIKPEKFLQIEIPLPPLAEQQRIVAKLDRLAARIEAARGLKSIVSTDASRMWKVFSRIVRSIPYTPRYIEEVAEFVDERRKPLSSAERSSRKGAYPYYGASGVIDYIDDYIFDEPLLLLSEDGANLINRSTPIAFVAEGKYWVNNHAHVLRPREGLVDLHFLRYALSDYDVSGYNFASAQAKLNQGNACKLRVPIPPINVQRRLVARLDHMQASVDRLVVLESQTSVALDALLPSLLDRAFKGDL